MGDGRGVCKEEVPVAVRLFPLTGMNCNKKQLSPLTVPGYRPSWWGHHNSRRSGELVTLHSQPGGKSTDCMHPNIPLSPRLGSPPWGLLSLTVVESSHRHLITIILHECEESSISRAVLDLVKLMIDTSHHSLYLKTHQASFRPNLLHAI